MDSIAFWLPLLFLFISALVGTILQRRSCDHCLKKFDRGKVILPDSSGDFNFGNLCVFAKGLELVFNIPRKENYGEVHSIVIHPNEVEKIPFILRPTPDEETRAGIKWERELLRIRKPSIVDRFSRNILNFYNMLRDAFGQAAQTILGAISKDSAVSKVKNADKRMTEIGSGLNDLVPNAWEPILEKYRGQKIVVERKSNNGPILEVGILEDYSSKYLLVRQVTILDEKVDQIIPKPNKKNPELFDLLYARHSSIVRMTIKD